MTQKNCEEETYAVDVNGTVFNISFPGECGHAIIDGEPVQLNIRMESPPNHYSLLVDGKSYIVSIEPDDEPGQYRVHAGGYDYEVEAVSERQAYLREFIRAAGAGKKDSVIKAPMPGLIVKLLAEENEEIEKGQGIMVMEAMKMENEIKAPMGGTLTKIKVATGDAVEKGQVLFEIE